jgi:hypothetical protein
MEPKVGFNMDFYHRDNGPAYIDGDGTKMWYRHGQLHRDTGPAVIEPDGTRLWYHNGMLCDKRSPVPAWIQIMHWIGLKLIGWRNNPPADDLPLDMPED